jgi:hypothetical protein
MESIAHALETLCHTLNYGNDFTLKSMTKEHNYLITFVPAW